MKISQALAANTRGRLYAGAPADITVLRPDPFTVRPDALDGVRAGCTLVGGEVTAAA